MLKVLREVCEVVAEAFRARREWFRKNRVWCDFGVGVAINGY